MGKTPIGWTDETWNPVRGCSRVSEGCRHCYAEQQAARIVRMGKGKPTAYDGLVKLVNGEPRWTGEVALDAKRLAAPLRWREPRRVFVDSMSDLFYDRRSNEDIAAVFGVMAATRHITYQMLTKYARRMREWFEWVVRKEPVAHARAIIWAYAFEHLRDLQHRGAFGREVDIEEQMRPADFAWPLPNVWLGVSVENQDALIERWPDLFGCPAAVHFFSSEPLLSALDFTACFASRQARRLWLIDGCESGAEARPAKPEWFASLEEQCRAAGVAYYHKQQMIGGKIVHDFPGRQEFPR